MFDDLRRRLLRASVHTGGDIAPLGVVSATHLRSVLLGRRQPKPGAPWTVHGATVDGPFDISGATLDRPLLLRDCEFRSPVELGGLRGSSVRFHNCRIPGLAADGLRLASDLSIIDSVIAGVSPSDASSQASGWSTAASLEGARIDGSLDLRGTTVSNPSGMAVFAHHMQVGNRLRMALGFVADGHVQLAGARIGAECVFIGARVSSRVGTAAVILNGATAGGSVLIGGRYRNQERASSVAYFGGSIDLRGLRTGGQLVVRHATIDAAAPTALNGQALSTVGDVVVDRADVRGAIDLTHATIGGQLSMRDYRPGALTGSTAVIADSATVGGNVDLSGARIPRGGVDFRGARIGGRFLAGGARLGADAAFALILDQASVVGDVLLDGSFTAEAPVSLVGARVQGSLSLHGARLRAVASGEGPAGLTLCTLDVRNATTAAMDLRWAEAGPRVRFDGAVTRYVSDVPARWPSMSVAGFKYERFVATDDNSDPWRLDDRLAWLRRQEPLDITAYQQLAQVFNSCGYASRSRRVKVEFKRRERKIQPWYLRFPSFAWDKLTFYGFQGWRLVALLVAMILGFSTLLCVQPLRESMRATGESGVVFTPSGPLPGQTPVSPPLLPGRCGAGYLRCFNQVTYSIDVIIPLVELGQRTTWRPDASTVPGEIVEYSADTLSILGWIISTLFALAFTNLGRLE